MGGREARDRGKAFEYRVRNLFRESGFGKAERVPVSGSARVMKGDLVVEIDGKEFKFELKYRSRKGVEGIYKWIEEVDKEKCDALIIGGYRKEPLVVLKFSQYVDLLKEIKSKKGVI